MTKEWAAVFLLFVFLVGIHSLKLPKAWAQDVTPNSLIGDLSGTLKGNPPPCWISVESVLQGIKKDRPILLIDVRLPDDYESFKIPGSLNIPLFAVKSKSFLKNKKLVLLDEGFGRMPMEDACHLLRSMGFDVSILNGGLFYWTQKGGAIEGERFRLQELNRISPMEFFREKEAWDWVFMDTSSTRASHTESLFPGAVHIPFDTERGHFSARYEGAVQGFGKTPFYRILLFNKDGALYDEIERSISKTRYRSVFFLKGGLDGYECFLADEVLAQQPKDQRTLTTRECLTCP